MKERLKFLSVFGTVTGFGIILIGLGWYLWYLFIKPEPLEIKINSMDDKVTFVLASEINSTSKEDNDGLITKIEYNIVKYDEFIEDYVLPNEKLVGSYEKEGHTYYLFLSDGYSFTLEHVKNRKFIFYNNTLSCDVSYNKESYEDIVLPFCLNDKPEKIDTYGKNNYKFEYSSYYNNFDKIMQYYKNDELGYSRISYNNDYIYLYGIIKNGFSVKKTKQIVARIYDAGDFFVLDCSGEFDVLESIE